MTLTLSIILYLITGAFVGISAGLFGIGGGTIIIPVLSFLFLKEGFSQVHTMHLAIGTSLITMIFTSFASTLSHHSFKRVDWNIFKKMVFGIFIGVVFGTFLSTKLNSKLLSIIFGTYLLFISFQLFFKSYNESNKINLIKKISNLKMTFGGLIIGSISGLLGVGGATFLIPFLTHLGKNIHFAIGTSSVCSFFIAVFGTINIILFTSHIPNLPSGAIGFIYLPAAICIATTSTIFAPIGSKISGKMSPKTLTRYFSIFLFIIAIKMFI